MTTSSDQQRRSNSELEEAIALAAAGRTEQALTFDGHPVSAAELVEEYELEQFVERAKTPNAGDPEGSHRRLMPAA